MPIGSFESVASEFNPFESLLHWSIFMNSTNTTTNVRNQVATCVADRLTPGWVFAGRTDTAVRQLVSGIVDSIGLRTVQSERRLDKRVPFPFLLRLTPITSGEEFQVQGEPVDVVGKSLAERGLTFYHSQNLPFRRAIATFESEDFDPAHLLLNISWSRFLRPGWYDSGGRFTHVLQEFNAAV